MLTMVNMEPQFPTSHARTHCIILWVNIVEPRLTDTPQQRTLQQDEYTCSSKSPNSIGFYTLKPPESWTPRYIKDSTAWAVTVWLRGVPPYTFTVQIYPNPIIVRSIIIFTLFPNSNVNSSSAMIILLLWFNLLSH